MLELGMSPRGRSSSSPTPIVVSGSSQGCRERRKMKCRGVQAGGKRGGVEKRKRRRQQKGRMWVKLEEKRDGGGGGGG